VTAIACALGQVFRRHSTCQSGCTPFSKDQILQEHRATEHRFVQSRRLHPTIREVHAAVVLLLRAQEKGRQ
jgi:hypothetical protein